jgi:hypothetical protein
MQQKVNENRIEKLNKISHFFPPNLELYVWYDGGYVRIRVTQRDFTEVTEYSF